MIRKPFALAASVFVLSALPAGLAAQPRPNSLAMPCAEIAKLIATRGAVILGTGEAYERVVHDQRFCLAGQTTQPYSVPARDQRYCLVGYVCAQIELDPT